jgi:hypothetical protein
MAADGDIVLDTPARFRAYLASENLTNWKGAIVLNLLGGNLPAGMRLANLTN